eukprot:365639-Chlamydomonas_euryale.AAC.10
MWHGGCAAASADVASAASAAASASAASAADATCRRCCRRHHSRVRPGVSLDPEVLTRLLLGPSARRRQWPARRLPACVERLNVCPLSHGRKLDVRPLSCNRKSAARLFFGGGKFVVCLSVRREKFAVLMLTVPVHSGGGVGFRPLRCPASVPPTAAAS